MSLLKAVFEKTSIRRLLSIPVNLNISLFAASVFVISVYTFTPTNAKDLNAPAPAASAAPQVAHAGLLNYPTDVIAADPLNNGKNNGKNADPSGRRDDGKREHISKLILNDRPRHKGTGTLTDTLKDKDSEDIGASAGTVEDAPPSPPSMGHGWVPPDITRGNNGRMELSITFDGGYESDDAIIILDALRQRGIKTTIFLTGMFIRNYPDIVRQIVRDGHEVGNHTMTHPHLTEFAANFTQKTINGVNKARLERELKEAAGLFKKVTGTEMGPLWRAPYGEINQELRRWAFECGYVHIGWTSDYERRESLDTLDWVHNRSSRLYRSPNQIKEKILSFGKESGGVKGGIILMHLGTERKSDRASDILADMLDGLMQRGYSFVKVSKLIEGNSSLAALEARKREHILKGLVKLEGPASEAKVAALKD